MGQLCQIKGTRLYLNCERPSLDNGLILRKHLGDSWFLHVGNQLLV